MSSKLSRSTPGERRAAAGWYIANARAPAAPVAGSTGWTVPCAWLILAPGMNVPIENRPSVTTTAGSSTAELALEERRAGGDLVGLRVPVVGRPALHDVGDEHVLAPPAERAKEPDEHAPGAAHERTPLAILVEARALADEHDLGVRIALARHRLRPALVEPALRAHPDLARDGLERRLALVAHHAGRPPLAPTGWRSLALRTQPRSTSTSAISTALDAAPLRRLSLTTQNASPRLPSIEGSWRTRPT